MAYTTIKKPSDYFNTKLYTGTGATQSITGVGFQPDFIWGKGRTLAGYNHGVVDIVRGTGKNIYTNLADAEETYSTGVTSFDSDGFSVGSGNVFNNGSNTYVAWNWLANNTSGSSNTVGDINSTVSVNTTSGFSIVSYTGTGSTATVGHSLGVAPKMYIVKRRDAGGASWCVYHASVGNTGALFLNSDAATSVSSSYWNNTSPTANVFTVGGTNQAVNASGGTYVAYCFSEVKGFSKFGSYTGNGSTDGPFIYTGFKPAFLIYKGASGTGTTDNWEMHDNKRDTSNPMDTVLYPNTTAAESNPASTTDRLDFLSNGFKIRTGSSDYNASGSTYIYMAFAEEPLVGDNPATAR